MGGVTGGGKKMVMMMLLEGSWMEGQMDKRFGVGGADPGLDWPVGTWAFCVNLMHRCFVQRGTCCCGFAVLGLALL